MDKIEVGETVSYAEIKESIQKGEVELLSILTKEQYKNNSYKVGE